jgi:hypothetical protein
MHGKGEEGNKKKLRQTVKSWEYQIKRRGNIIQKKQEENEL